MFKKVLLSLLVIYTLLGFIVLPMILKSKVVEIANAQMNAKLSIQDIDFNPFIFKLGVYGLELRDLDDKHLVSLKKFELNFEPHALYNGTINIKTLLLDSPQISLVYEKDKSFNLASITKEKPQIEEKKTEKTTMPRIVLGNLLVKNGTINYKDFTKAKEYDFSLNRLGFNLKDIDTNEFDKSGASLKFFTKFADGGLLEVKSKITGFKPLKLEGSVYLEFQKLYDTWKYVQDDMKIEVANGSLEMSANYAINVDNLDETLIDNAKLSLLNLRVKPKAQNQDVLNLGSFTVSDVSISPFKQKVHVGNVALNALHVEVSKDKKGIIDWAEWFKSEAKEEVVKTQTEVNSTKEWDVVVDTLNLKKIALGFDDASVSPSVKTNLNELNVSLENITLAGIEPLLYEIDLKLNDEFTCKANGDLIHKKLDLNIALACRDFDITHYNPYITKAVSKELVENDISLKNASLDISILANVTDENITLKQAIIDLNKLKINKTSLKKSFVTLDKLEVRSYDLLVKTKTKETDVNLQKININLNKLAFYDHSISKTQIHKIDTIKLNAKNINSKKNTWLNYDTSIKLHTGGIITSKGKLQHTPLKQKGSLNINKLSLKEISPYLQEGMFVDLKDGYLGLKSKISYAKSKTSPDLHVEGAFTLNSLNIADARTNETLLSIANTDLNSFGLKLFPSSIYIDKITLDSFYVDAQIDKNKVMNFAKLTKPKDENLSNTQEINQELSTKKPSEEFSYKVSNIHVKNGTGNFADYSLPIEFKTSMHSLDGDIYSVSNTKGEITFIDINGEVDEYGATKIKGSLESANFKSFTDISVNFKNLDLTSYSGYSAQFAGHKIDKGKLFLDLEYKIQDSKLLGKNSLIIKQIELGDEVDDENITTLPLGFAIALLEDKDGIIDIDMPVEGDLDEPDFKYGALLLKTFANLIVKAVASPFKFLGSALGINGEELEFSDFEPASAIILAPEREKMDSVAKILNKKPKLFFEITGTYDVEKDSYAMKREKAKAKVLELNSKKEKATLITTDAVEIIYTKQKGDDALDKIKDEIKKKFPDDKVYKNEYRKVLFDKTIRLEKVSQTELDDLAKARANALRNYLIDRRNIDTSRIKIAPVKQAEIEHEKFVKQSLKIIIK